MGLKSTTNELNTYKPMLVSIDMKVVKVGLFDVWPVFHLMVYQGKWYLRRDALKHDTFNQY